VYCGREEPAYKGIHLITNDGTVQYFCSSKCRKNALKLKRDKRKLKWTEAHKIARDKAKNLNAKLQEKKPAVEEHAK
jgi:large subunit ribosomal protein L24e